MNEPYKMVFVNLISLITLSLGIIIYKYIYPKKNINLLALLILISLLPLISILRKGGYESGDLTIHSGFAISFFESLKDGNIIPRWSSQIIYGYGYPLFLFTYPLPYYLASFIHFLGLSFIASLKTILIFSFVLSGVTMYFFVKEELQNKYAAFVAALIYLFAPYHLVDLHFRVAIGEIIAFSILPLCFLTIKKMSYKISLKWFLLSSVSLSLLILSHQAISLISFPFLIFYCLYLWVEKNLKNIKYITTYILSLIFGLLLSSFYWIPVILEAKFMNLLSTGDVSFIPLIQLLYSPWIWGFLFQGPQGELSFIIGYAQLFIVISSIILFLKNKINEKEKKLYIISLISLFILLALTQSISKPIWMDISLLRGFQFSYRLLLLVSFFISIIAGITIKNVNNKLLIAGLSFLIVFSTILNWGNRQTAPELNDQIIRYEFPTSMTKVGQGTTIWVNSNEFTSSQRTVPHIIALEGKANIVEIHRNSIRHEYLINVLSEKAKFKENTLYFPGWTVKLNNKNYPFNFMYHKFPGVIMFDLEKGVNKIEVVFLDTKIRTFSFYLSSISFIFLILLSLITFLKSIK